MYFKNHTKSKVNLDDNKREREREREREICYQYDYPAGPIWVPCGHPYETHIGNATGFHMGPIWAGPCK